jgi:hypothetical protein
MKKITDENIDEIMFQLLEGEITGEERKQLLSAIEADAGYSKLWQTWQQTILSPESESLVMDTRPLKKKSARIIPFNYKYAIAAMLVLGLGLAVLLFNRRTDAPGMTDALKPTPAKPPHVILPQPDFKSNDGRKEDSIIPLKEKIRMIANKPQRKSEDVRNPEFQDEFFKTPEMEMPESNEKIIAYTPENKNPVEKPSVVSEDPNAHMVVISSTQSKPWQDNKDTAFKKPEPKKETFLSRMFSRPKFKIENDSNAITNKRLIIENKQYRIIAGF